MFTQPVQHHGTPFKPLLVTTCGNFQLPLAALWPRRTRNVPNPKPGRRHEDPRPSHFSLILKINSWHLYCQVGRFHPRDMIPTLLIDHDWDPCRVWIPKCPFAHPKAMENVPCPRNKLWEMPPILRRSFGCHEVAFYNKKKWRMLHNKTGGGVCCPM